MHIAVNLMKITPAKYLMCATSNNQTIKTKCMEIINTSKSRKQREKRKREHTKFVYPVRSNTDLVGGREHPSVPL